MPIYEFVCRKCNTDFEKIVSSAQRDAVPCPACGNAKSARKVSLTSPARVSQTVATRSDFGGCGAPSCCGGGCQIPN